MHAKKHLQTVLLMLGFLAFAACKPSQKVTANNQYNEDLGRHRNTYPAVAELPYAKADTSVVTYLPPVVKATVSEEIDTLLNDIAYHNKKKDYVEGFTIQVYSGSSRSEAVKAQGKVRSLMPESRPWMEFSASSYRVKVGRFSYAIEAQRIYKQLKKEMATAMVIPERFKPGSR